MQKTASVMQDSQVALNIEQLMALLGCGRFTAEKIAREAEAKIELPTRRNLYNKAKIEDYLNSRSK